MRRHGHPSHRPPGASRSSMRLPGAAGLWAGCCGHSGCFESQGILITSPSRLSCKRFTLRCPEKVIAFWTWRKPCLTMYFFGRISDLPSRTHLPDSSYFFCLNKWPRWACLRDDFVGLCFYFLTQISFFPLYLCFSIKQSISLFVSCLVPLPLICTLNERQKIHGERSCEDCPCP